jgi:hypothetical protein
MEYVHGAHTRTLLEEGYIAIEQMFDKPENNLRTAVDNEGRLGKSATSFNDVILLLHVVFAP